MLCRIFRPFDWYHSLVPKTFYSGVIQDLDPFLESSFWPITRKRLFFFCILSILRSHYFSISNQKAYSLFWVLIFFENFSYYWNSFSPFSSEMDAVRRNIFVLKNG